MSDLRTVVKEYIEGQLVSCLHTLRISIFIIDV